MSKFHDVLKKAEVMPVYKMDTVNDKQSSLQQSTLSSLSKVFGKLIYSQLNTYMNYNKLSTYLTGFCENNNTQHALLNMIEKLEK